VKWRYLVNEYNSCATLRVAQAAKYCCIRVRIEITEIMEMIYIFMLDRWHYVRHHVPSSISVVINAVTVT